MKENKTQLWDKKSKSFPRYSENLNEIQKKTFECLQRSNITLSGKTLIDVGCGTGVWTLHLAQRAKSITALDASQGMLEVLQEDAKTLNLSNICLKNSNFEDFYHGTFEKFDLAFTSMSPALNKDEDYKAFLELASIRVYLGWQEYRQSDFLAPLFKAFNAKQKCFNELDLENFLLRQGIIFHKESFEEIRTNKKPRKIAIENAMWHLNMAGIFPSTNELESLVTQEFITETVKSKIKLLVF